MNKAAKQLALLLSVSLALVAPIYSEEPRKDRIVFSDEMRSFARSIYELPGQARLAYIYSSRKAVQW